MAVDTETSGSVTETSGIEALDINQLGLLRSDGLSKSMEDPLTMELFVSSVFARLSFFMLLLLSVYVFLIF